MKLDEAGQKARSEFVSPLRMHNQHQPLNNRSSGRKPEALLYVSVSPWFPKLWLKFYISWFQLLDFLPSLGSPVFSRICFQDEAVVYSEEVKVVMKQGQNHEKRKAQWRPQSESLWFGVDDRCETEKSPRCCGIWRHKKHFCSMLLLTHKLSQENFFGLSPCDIHVFLEILMVPVAMTQGRSANMWSSAWTKPWTIRKIPGPGSFPETRNPHRCRHGEHNQKTQRNRGNSRKNPPISKISLLGGLHVFHVSGVMFFWQ